jgi:hypothetical protein
MDKLTPVGSQDEFYRREEADREVEMGIFDNNLGKAPDSGKDDECIISDSDEELSKDIALIPEVRKRTRDSHEATYKSKRQNQTKEGVPDDEREKTYESLLELLSVLTPPENFPDLLNRTAKQLENDMFNKLSNGRSVNVLGRSSTLLTTAKKQDITVKYLREKEDLTQRVKAYVEIATRNDVELEQIQQGEIWEIIKDILDSAS